MQLPIQFVLAEAAQQAEPPGITGMLVMLVPMIIIWYILLIKPQRKKQQQHEELNKSLKVGDKVVTLGGIYGEIAGVDDAVITLKIADKVKIQLNRSSIAEKVKTETEGDAKKA